MKTFQGPDDKTPCKCCGSRKRLHIVGNFGPHYMRIECLQCTRWVAWAKEATDTDKDLQEAREAFHKLRSIEPKRR